jgi:hypothetical protein
VGEGGAGEVVCAGVGIFFFELVCLFLPRSNEAGGYPYSHVHTHIHTHTLYIIYMCVYIYIHAYIHTYIHTYIHPVAGDHLYLTFTPLFLLDFS